MRLSIRVRLTIWYTAFIAAYLGVVASGAYAFLLSVTMSDVDDLLARSASTTATAMEFERHGGASDTAAARAVAEGLKLPDVAVLILDASSRAARRAELHPQRPMTLSEEQRHDLDDSLDVAARRAPSAPDLSTVVVARQEVRIFTLPYRLGRRPLVIAVARSLAAREAILDQARVALLSGLPLLLVVAALGGYWLAGKSLAPVAAMSAQAAAIGAGTLHERLPVRRPTDELGRLATILNGLLARLEQAFLAQHRLVAEASHELRTPVAVISGESEHALSRPDRPASELRDSLAVIRAESLRLRSAIDDLFFLARADAGERRLHMEPVRLGELASACARAARQRAPERAITLAGAPDGGIAVNGDAELLRRVLDNLVNNAIAYSRPGGPITVRPGGNAIVQWVDIVDSGPGVPEDQRERVFDRFFRGDEARALSESNGAGLGLAIARWVARSHGGDVTIRDEPGGQFAFRLSIPAAPRSVAGGGDSGQY
ncbi:MAG: HAMP domain-containing histidine kinase [Gemmatimonadaceae bacterium]|nr:HAMP domain-containing histidine kinase [Gemmatimonadaceae bacterium]